MCGIAGAISLSQNNSNHEEVVKNMVQTLRRRGPDSYGTYNIESSTIGMTRLGIMDIDSGQQPFIRDEGTLALVCNGEIYNQDIIRNRYKDSDYQFQTRSDAEVILPLYKEHGVDCVNHLKGMFGFAITDSRRKRVIIARDRLGIKPLYYTIKDNTLYFGSEIKALRAANVVPRDMDEIALQDYLQNGYVNAPRTIYKNVFKLKPGHLILIENGSYKIQQYWDYKIEPDTTKSEDEWRYELDDVLKSSVSRHLMSDVPVGAFLSGGVDSSLVVALIKQVSEQPLKTFTIGFGGNTGGFVDETTIAREVSEHYATEHHQFIVNPHLDDIIDDILEAFDEPFSDDSIIPSYYLTQQVSSHVKVALSGLGGDELFGGYERYLGMKLSQQFSRIPNILSSNVLEPIVNRLPEKKNGNNRINHIKRFIRAASQEPNSRYREMTSIFNFDDRNALLKNQGASIISNCQKDIWDSSKSLVDGAITCDFNSYLPEDILALSDRLSMWHSLELRVPLLDDELVDFSSKIPAHYKIKYLNKKHLLKEVAKPYLPKSIFQQKKQGFSSPMASWLRSDLRSTVQETLSEKQLSKHGLFNQQAVDHLLHQHMTLREQNNKKIFTLFMFQKWFDKFMN